MLCVTRSVGVVLAVVLLAPGLRAADAMGSAEEQLLRKAGIGTASDKLLAFLRLRSEAGEDLRNLDALVRRLGHDAFAEREKATAKLIALGRAALPALKRATADRDAEVARRARKCVAAIERGTIPGLPLAVVRMLLQKRPPRTVAALVGYVPFEPDEEVVEVIYFGLEKLVQGKSVDAALLAALRDKLPQRRALAACLVGRWGTEAQRRQVRKLLEDADAEVRLRAAQGLLGANDDSGLPALVALLEMPSMPVAWQAEELLHYAAGEKTPNAVLGRGKPKERKTCQVAWESWLKTKGSLVDLKARQKQVQRPGLVLIFEGNTNWLEAPAKDELEPYWSKHIWLCGCEGQPRCNPYTYAEFSAKQLNRPRLRWLAFCGLGSSGVAVYAGLKKSGFSILWNPGREKELYHPDHPVRLENGNCMKIVEQDRFDSLYRVIEEDEKRRIVWESASTEELCALVVWPLVRVGFGRPAGGNMGLDTPVARLKALKHHPQAIVRRLAAERLRTYPSDKAICQAMVEALKDSDLGVQSQALCFLETAKPENIYPGIPRLVQLLCNPENGRLGNPGDVLERCGRKAIPELMKAFEDRKGPNATLRRSRAIMVLACLVDVPDPILHRTLKAAFEDEDPKVRMEVIWSLFGPQTKARRNYFPYLLSRLQDPNPKVVDTVLRKLGRLGEAAEAAVPDLTKLLNQHKYRDDAIFLLGAVGNKNPKVLPLILGQLKPGKESITYCSIASALGKYAGSKDASMIIPVLVKMLKEYPVNRVEKAVVSALEQFGPSAITAVPVLMRLINKRRDNDHILRALEKIDPATAEKTRTILYRKELEFEKAFKK